MPMGTSTWEDLAGTLGPQKVYQRQAHCLLTAVCAELVWPTPTTDWDHEFNKAAQGSAGPSWAIPISQVSTPAALSPPAVEMLQGAPVLLKVHGTKPLWKSQMTSQAGERTGP